MEQAERKPIAFGLLAKAGHPMRRFAAGAVVFAKGDAGSTMYAVRQGRVRVEVDGRTVETLGPDRIFGEMALIDGSPRSATAIAEEDCELAELDRKAFVFLVHQTPYFALDVMATLAARLRRMNEAG